MARTLDERSWIHDPKRLKEVRAYLTAMIADEEIELEELVQAFPADDQYFDQLIGIGRRRQNIRTLRATLCLLPNMPERKGTGY